MEALHKIKFTSCQKKHITSQKWGFTKFNANKSEDLVAERQVITQVCGIIAGPASWLLHGYTIISIMLSSKSYTLPK